MKAVVCGAGGLIGQHLCKRLKNEGYYVVGLSKSAYPRDDNPCDEYWTCDLRKMQNQFFIGASQCYQLACEVGGLGYIANHANDAEILYNSTSIDMNVLEACRINHVPKLFFASSACVYNGVKRFFAETDVYPANCSNEFAWQKLYAERLYQAYARVYGMQVRIGRLFNTYGIGMQWTGGREKSVAALCRKIAESRNGGTIEVWGSGQQTRSYTHVEDTVEGIWRLMQSDVREPINIGPSSEVTIRDLVKAIENAAGKQVFCSFVEGPVGVTRICSNNTVIRLALGWEPKIDIYDGLKTVYPWIEQQVLDARTKAA